MFKSRSYEKSIGLISTLAVAITALSMASAHAAPTYNKPIYNPETKSYFELFSPGAERIKASKVRLWGDIGHSSAIKRASNRFYKGVRGRLAVVKSAETHEFLANKLRPEGAAWIGLRYFCRYRKFMWVTGEIFQPGKDYSRWGPHTWSVEGSTPKNKNAGRCYNNKKSQYLPVHYWGREHGLYWNANGPDKRFNAMIIEYPTGKP